MKTKTIIVLSLFLLAAWSGLCLARSDTQIYRNEKCVCWADAGTLEQIDGSVYEIWVTVEISDGSAPNTTIIERVDLSDHSYSRQRMFIWDGPHQVDLPMDDAGKWYVIQPGSMDEALYDFVYEILRRKGKI
ncbi:MAG: hypothetical protein IJ812_08305 [Schwartzia sp.]|nr:hypothetical protein [Schwartzia sp. (in: firmicutes)]